jgi:hypothetical protein
MELREAAVAAYTQGPPAALSAIEAALASLTCLEGPLPREDVAFVLHVGVHEARLAGDADGARTWADAAACQAPDVAPDGALPPETLDLLAQARARLQTGPRGTVVARSAIWIDGRELARGTELDLPACEHVLQLPGAWGVAPVDVPAGERVRLPPESDSGQAPGLYLAGVGAGSLAYGAGLHVWLEVLMDRHCSGFGATVEGRDACGDLLGIDLAAWNTARVAALATGGALLTGGMALAWGDLGFVPQGPGLAMVGRW